MTRHFLCTYHNDKSDFVHLTRWQNSFWVLNTRTQHILHTNYDDKTVCVYLTWRQDSFCVHFVLVPKWQARFCVLIMMTRQFLCNCHNCLYTYHNDETVDKNRCGEYDGNKQPAAIEVLLVCKQPGTDTTFTYRVRCMWSVTIPVLWCHLCVRKHWTWFKTIDFRPIRSPYTNDVTQLNVYHSTNGVKH